MYAQFIRGVTTYTFVHNLGEDGCRIIVSLNSCPVDPTFSMISRKSLRVDKIQALADGLTTSE